VKKQSGRRVKRLWAGVTKRGGLSYIGHSLSLSIYESKNKAIQAGYDPEDVGKCTITLKEKGRKL
jgi:hypothetical protein